MASAKFSAVLLTTIVAMAVASVVFTYGLLSDSKTINTVGNLSSVGVGVYKEATCINAVNEIDWGYMEPGSSKTETVYIRNEGTVSMTLDMAVGNWNPVEAPTYMTVSWNRQGSQVTVGSVVQAVITLSVSSSISDISGFSFDITIIGTE